MLNDEQAAVFARLIAECAGAAYGNHGVDTADAYRVLMAYIGDLLAAERERAVKIMRETTAKTLNLHFDQRAYSWHEIQGTMNECEKAILALKGK